MFCFLFHVDHPVRMVLEMVMAVIVMVLVLVLVLVVAMVVAAAETSHVGSQARICNRR